MPVLVLPAQLVVKITFVWSTTNAMEQNIHSTNLAVTFSNVSDELFAGRMCEMNPAD